MKSRIEEKKITSEKGKKEALNNGKENGKKEIK